MKRRSQQVRTVGTPKKAVLGNRLTIHNDKENKIWCPRAEFADLYPQIGRWVQTVDYDNHFIAINPEFVAGVENAWFAFCSCGAAATIVGYNVYKEGASLSTHGETKGELAVCSFHAQNGRHSDGSS